jgi:2-desacetyl-2-hydroxyethyl bacteriochlorophyllide A dehydrogenase
MKAAVVPAAKSRWVLREVETPRPGPGQVLIRMRASGLCFTDVHLTRGDLPVPFPRWLGHEPVGEVVETGAGVTCRKAGDRVGVPWVQGSCLRCEWCERGKPMFCAEQVGTGVQTMGGHAEFMVAEAAGTVLLPERLSYEQAAPVFCAGYTVWSGLRWAEPAPGETVAVVGVGGLGHLAVQFAKAAGFRTIAVSRSPDKDPLIREFGADEIVRDGAGLAAAGGADVVLGTGNSMAAMGDAVAGLRPDGRLVAMGFEAAPLTLSPADLIMKRVRVLGSQQNHVSHLHEALRIVASGRVKVLTETYPLEQVGRAYDRVEAGQVRFRAVLTM